MNSQQITSFDSEGARISFNVQGTGVPLVLVHGFGMTAEVQFGLPGITKGLAENFMVIEFDARGHGASELLMDPAAYGLHMITDIGNLLDHLRIERAHIVGYSMGGIIATKFMTHYPERVLKAVSGGQGWMKSEEMDHLQMPEALKSGKGFEPLIKWLTPAGQNPPSDEMIALTNSQIFALNDPNVLAVVWQGFEGLDLEIEEIRSNRIDVLFIIGELDPMRCYVDRMKSVMPRAQFHTVPGTDHVTTPFHPEFLQRIGEFLTEQ